MNASILLRSTIRSLVVEAGVLSGAAWRSRQTLKDRAKRSVSPPVHVVNLHGTPVRNRDNFCRQVEWVCRHFTPISAQALRGMRRGEVPELVSDDGKPWVLFTFDDGLASNYHVAAPVLESMNARGLFFVVPDFATRQNKEARSFYYGRIRECPDATIIADTPEEWTPMTPEQIADLAGRGHEIGNHTFSHSRLDMPTVDVDQEIIKSAYVISQWIGKEVNSFTWTYSWASISVEAWKAACDHHEFVFAPCPGVFDPDRDTLKLIWRSNVEAWYGASELQFIYSGLVHPLWHRRRERLRGMLGA